MTFTPTITDWSLVIAALIVFSYIAKQKKSLTLEGVLFADAVGLIVFFTLGWSAFLAIVLFFVLGELATRWARNVSKNKEHGARGIGNILGNAGIALLAAALGQQLTFFASVSAALGDTLSSEIGQLSKDQPRLITTWEKSFSGTDGAVTMLGFGAAIFGGIAMGLLHYAFFQNAKSFWIIASIGLLGSAIDSVLGATLQQKGWLDNNSVNFLMTAISALLAAALWAAIP